MTIFSTIRLKIKYRGNEHEYLRKLLDIRLAKKDVIIDCGANIGEITKILARNGSHVFAFEPNPFAFDVLRKQTRKLPNVECIQAGVYTHDGNMLLYLHEMAKDDQVFWSSGSSLLSCKGNIDVNESVEIKVVNLSEFILKKGGRIRILKMDIEGAECEVLPHMIETGAIERVDHVFVERHDNKIPELKPAMLHLEKMLAEKGIKNVYLDWI